MAWTVESLNLGLTPILTTDISAKFPIGTIVRGSDPVYGDAEFIYLPGVPSTILGSVVQFTTYNGGSTTLLPSTANLNAPIAVAMSPCLAGQWGWYQVQGAAIVTCGANSVTAGAPVYAAGGGVVTGTGAAGKQICDCIAAAASGTPAATQCVLQLNRPSMQGAIT